MEPPVRRPLEGPTRTVNWWPGACASTPRLGRRPGRGIDVENRTDHEHRFEAPAYRVVAVCLSLDCVALRVGTRRGGSRSLTEPERAEVVLRGLEPGMMLGLCSVRGCVAVIEARGLCNQHYLRAQSNDGDPLATRVKRKGTCSLDGCEALHKGHGLCERHLANLRRTGAAEPTGRAANGAPQRWIETAMAVRAERGDGCWDDWPYGLGYGYPVVSGGKAGWAIMALDGRPRPSLDLVMLHSCDRPICLQPRHLRWGTNVENVKEAWERGMFDDRMLFRHQPRKSRRS